jgi:hypothetical protein
MKRLLGLLALGVLGCDVGQERGSTAGPLRYDLEGLPSCTRISALTSWQGSCEEGQACAWAPELGAGVCAPGCDTDDDCPEQTVCRHTDDGQGWERTWCAPVTRDPA